MKGVDLQLGKITGHIVELYREGILALTGGTQLKPV